MPKAKRDYRAEYRRRITGAVARGISRSRPAGHPSERKRRSACKRPRRHRSEWLRLGRACRQKLEETSSRRTPSPLRDRAEHHRTTGPPMGRSAGVAAPDAALFRWPGTSGGCRRLHVGVQGRTVYVRRERSSYERTIRPAFASSKA